MNKQIQEYLERARNLFNRIEMALESKKNLFIELTECVYNLQRVRISVSYQKKETGFSLEDQNAIEEIVELARNAEKLARDVNAKKRNL
ncbi:MAG: hypothetical protein AB1656_13460 [Candidatus Omnitrophota bacterium]